MAFQPVPDTAEFRLKYSRSADYTWETILYYRDTVVGWTTAHLASMAAAIEAAWAINLQPQINGAHTLDTIDFRDLGAEFGQQGQRTVAQAGTLAGDAGIASAPMRVMFRCTAGAAPRKGAIYHTGTVDADIDSDAFTLARAAAVENAWTAMVAVSDLGSEAFVRVSRFQTVGDPPVLTPRNPALTNTVEDVLARRIVSSQARRRRKLPLYVS